LENAMNTPDEDRARPGKTRRRWFAGLAALGGLGLLATGAAVAQPWGHRHGRDPEEIARRLERRIDRMIRNVGGTPEQRERIVAIAKAALADLRPMRDQMRLARGQGLDLLAATTIDRPALEKLRSTQMQTADALSRRMLQAMADAAEVLTPEQRTKVAERIKHRMEHRWRR
jgi:periplasmic protein CpxP/Spy